MTEITYTTLATIDVSGHTEKKGSLTYLSWTWAIDQLLRCDPNASWEYRCWDDRPVCILHDGTAMVCCTVTVGGRSKTAWLPVMDSRNRAVVGPDAFAINSAMMRSLVKAIALCGLGLAVYAGLDSPMEDDAAAAAAQDAYTAWLESLTPIADTGDFQALVAAIKLQPAYAAVLRGKDLNVWTALKARQEAVVAPAVALVQTMAVSGLPVSAVTVAVGDAPPFPLPLSDGDDGYAKGIALVKAAVKRTVKAMPS